MPYGRQAGGFRLRATALDGIMPFMNPEEAVARNLKSWEERTPIHLRSEMYRQGMDTLRAGGITLAPPTDTEIGDVADKRVLHVQCHIGLDTLSLARLGANVTGLDFSPAALAAARELAAELGLSVRFVCSDAQKADETLAGEQFDMVFASFGVFCWIPDVRRWIRSAANLLAPGGALYIADGHPVLDMFDEDPDAPGGIGLRYDYFAAGAQVYGSYPTYADDGGGQAVSGAAEYCHPIGEFVTAAATAGLAVEFVHEFRGSFFQRWPSMVAGPDGTWDFPSPLAGTLPMVFSMRATKPC